MDSLDRSILKELLGFPAASPAQSDVRKSMRGVARKLGVSESSVRDRVTRMRKSGFLKGWTPFVNPNLLGLSLSLILFDARATPKHALVKKLQLMHGVASMVNFIGTRIGMLLFYESPENLKRELELIARVSEAENLTHSELRFPPTKVRLTATDLKVLKSFHEGPERTFKDLGRESGLSSRTVRRRIQRLTDSFALFAVPEFDPGKLEGAILATMVVEYTSPEEKMSVDSRIGSEYAGVLVSSQRGMQDRGAFMMMLTNVSTPRQMQAWVSELQGVRSCRVDIAEEVFQRFEWYREALKNRSLLEGRTPMEPAAVIR